MGRKSSRSCGSAELEVYTEGKERERRVRGRTQQEGGGGGKEKRRKEGRRLGEDKL